MKKYLISLLTLFLIPLTVLAKDNDKVKVYLFEAGGCPYCEMEMEYLEGLDSYNEKFVIVEKELYVDHNDWAPGEDFITGAKVAMAFNDAGFEKAGYNGTPFVVISDLYAASNYSASLESVINDAYEKGDKDVVSCIEKGKDKCLSGYKDSKYQEEAEDALKVTLTSQITSCVKNGGDSSCTDIYDGTDNVKLAASIYDFVADINTCIDDGGASECTEKYIDTDNEDYALRAYSTLSASSDSTGSTTPIEASKKASPVAIVVVLLSAVIVLGLLIFGATKLNKDEKSK